MSKTLHLELSTGKNVVEAEQEIIFLGDLNKSYEERQLIDLFRLFFGIEAEVKIVILPKNYTRESGREIRQRISSVTQEEWELTNSHNRDLNLLFNVNQLKILFLIPYYSVTEIAEMTGLGCDHVKLLIKQIYKETGQNSKVLLKEFLDQHKK